MRACPRARHPSGAAGGKLGLRTPPAQPGCRARVVLAFACARRHVPSCDEWSSRAITDACRGATNGAQCFHTPVSWSRRATHLSAKRFGSPCYQGVYAVVREKARRRVRAGCRGRPTCGGSTVIRVPGARERQCGSSRCVVSRRPVLRPLPHRTRVGFAGAVRRRRSCSSASPKALGSARLRLGRRDRTEPVGASAKQ